MHQSRFRQALYPRPRWGSLQRSPDPLAVFKGPTSKVREGKARGEGTERNSSLLQCRILATPLIGASSACFKFQVCCFVWKPEHLKCNFSSVSSAVRMVERNGTVGFPFHLGPKLLRTFDGPLLGRLRDCSCSIGVKIEKSTGAK